MAKKPLFIIFLSLVSGMFISNILKLHLLVGGILFSILLSLSILLIFKKEYHRFFLTFLIPFLLSLSIFFINDKKLNTFSNNSEIALTGRVVSISDNTVLLDKTRIYLGNKKWEKLNRVIKVSVMDYSNRKHEFFNIGSWMFVRGTLRRISRYPFLIIYTSNKNYSFAPYHDSLLTTLLYKLGRLRKDFKEFLNENSRYWDLIIAVTFGEPPNSANKKLFLDTGLYHLFVVSGLHVNLLTTLVYLLVGLLIADSRVRTLLTIFFLLFYGLTVGYSFPTIRAVVMISTVLFFKVLDYPQDKFNILGFTGILVFLMNPMSVFSMSFQLSFVSTFIFMSVFLEKQYNFLDFLKTTLLATIYLMPFTVLYFGKVYLLSVILSSFLVLTTITPMILGSTMGFLAYAVKLNFLTKIFIFGIEPFINFMRMLIGLILKFPLAKIVIPEGWRISLFYLLVSLITILPLLPLSKGFNFFKHSGHIP